MKTLVLLGLLSLPAIAAAARGGAACPPERGCGRDACAALARSTAPLELTASERGALLFQLEEERMARELYAAFGASSGDGRFARIQAAELRHAALLRTLAARAGIAVPAAVPGRFDSAVLQQRHDTLLARGRTSLSEALAAGAAVERQDIADLEKLARVATSTEFKAAIAQLASASARHLAAFAGSAVPLAGEGGRGRQAGRRARI